MLDTNRITPFFNPKLIGNTPEDAEHFRDTNNNFANQHVSSTAREFVASEEDHEYCPNCNRKFFMGRLQLHLKTCKNGKPLKAIKKIIAEKTETQNDTFAILNKNTELTTNARISTLDTEEQEASFAFQGPTNSQEKMINWSPSQLSQFKTTKELASGKNNITKSGESNQFIQQDEYKQENSPNEIPNKNDEHNPSHADDDIERQKIEDGRVCCNICNRFFHEDRISKHEKACMKSNKKRPVFNTIKQRAIPEQGGELLPKKAIETFKPKKSPVLKENSEDQVVHKGEDQKKKLPKWKAEHENFLRNLQFNRKIKGMKQRGEDTSNLIAPTIVNDSYVDCPYCFRKFAPATAERHIPKCKDIFNRPKPPRSLKLAKIDDIKSNGKSKSQMNAEKEPITLRKSSNNGPKEVMNPKKSGNSDRTTNSNEKLESIISCRSPQSNFSSRNGMDNVESRGSPKEAIRLPHFLSPKASNKLLLKKVHSETSDRQIFLPEIHKTEGANSVNNGYELNLSDQKDRSARSQSPNNGKEGKKVYSVPIPKKEDLLHNYQNIIARSSAYSTVTCPHCLRSFAFHASERHIPICKNSQTRIMKKSYEHDKANEEKFQAKMYLTNLVTKFSYKYKGSGENEKVHTRAIHSDIESIDSGHLFSNGGKMTLRGKHALSPIKMPSNWADPQIPILEKPSLLQKAKLVPNIPSFCTSCGTKFSKMHKFCGHCGTKKNAL